MKTRRGKSGKADLEEEKERKKIGKKENTKNYLTNSSWPIVKDTFLLLIYIKFLSPPPQYFARYILHLC